MDSIEDFVEILKLKDSDFNKQKEGFKHFMLIFQNIQ